jgi:TolB protein
MTLSPEEPNRELPPSEFSSVTERKPKWLAWLALAGLLMIGLLGWPLITEVLWGPLQGRAASSQIQAATATSSLLSQSAETPSPTPLIEDEISVDEPVPEAETAFISISIAGYSHLYLFDLNSHKRSLISDGEWDDIHPELSADGKTMAFASNRGGHWDLYTLNLQDGNLKQISDDLIYEASPSWSFDGSWLAFERYDNQNLDIYIRPLDGSVEPVRITTDAAVDFSPAWSPIKQQIAFVSHRTGLNQIWLVDLTANSAERFQQLVSGEAQKDPAWSADGRYLAWSAYEGGLWRVYTLDVSAPAASPQLIGAGEQPAWSQTGEQILAVVRNPNESYVTAYTIDGGLAMALETLPGQVRGLTWATGIGTNTLSPALLSEPVDGEEKSWLQQAQLNSAERQELLPLSNVDTAYAQLNALALPYFDALRARSAQALGWDLLSNLENAYLPLNVPLPPDRQSDWLYSGRAFSLIDGLLAADWLRVVREDFAGETYWRVYVRTANQDGSYGQPMQETSWDFDARFSGDNEAYQAGGRLSENIASGYWLDFSQLAGDFAWERLPSLSNWRSYYQGTLFAEFALRQGLSWEDAMLQLYPPEVLTGP